MKGAVATENFDAYKLLGKIDSPSDLKALAAADLPLLAKEIRQYLSYRVRENGGHLSSNLGRIIRGTSFLRSSPTVTVKRVYTYYRNS